MTAMLTSAEWNAEEEGAKVKLRLAVQTNCELHAAIATSPAIAAIDSCQELKPI